MHPPRVTSDELQPKLQPQLLRQINALNSKEDLLNYVLHCHHLLDLINLVTCLYRLARAYVGIQSAALKLQWRHALLDDPAFNLLLGTIQTRLVQGVQALQSGSVSEVHGLNARCLSNLIWSLVKLEVAGEDCSPLVRDVIASASPLVLTLLPECSGQGLANLLWSYARIPTTPAPIMTGIVLRMVELLQQPTSSSALDAQALSNSIWAIAHVRARHNPELEDRTDWQEAVTSFLLLMSNQCLSLLARVMGTAPSISSQPSVVESKLSFSCQALVNIVWSLSSILGSACGTQEPIGTLFLLIRQLSVAKLRSMLGGLQLDQPWVYSLSGSFNEQALSNLVFAYDKAHLLSSELMQAVLDCATQRVLRPAPADSKSQSLGNVLTFKPQELCTLLRACQLNLANHQPFLSALAALLAQYPHMTHGWTNSELTDLERAMRLMEPGHRGAGTWVSGTATPGAVNTHPRTGGSSPALSLSHSGSSSMLQAAASSLMIQTASGPSSTVQQVMPAPSPGSSGTPTQPLVGYPGLSTSSMLSLLGQHYPSATATTAQLLQQPPLPQQTQPLYPDLQGRGVGVPSSSAGMVVQSGLRPQQMWALNPGGALTPVTVVYASPGVVQAAQHNQLSHMQLFGAPGMQVMAPTSVRMPTLPGVPLQQQVQQLSQQSSLSSADMNQLHDANALRAQLGQLQLSMQQPPQQPPRPPGGGVM